MYISSTRLGVGDAAAESFYGFGFVGEGGDGLDEARELEDFADVAGGVKDFQAAALALKGDERAHEGADAGAVHLGDSGEIHQNVGRTSFGELAQLRSQRVVARADDDAALQIENGYVSGLPRRNLQAHDSLPLRPRR